MKKTPLSAFALALVAGLAWPQSYASAAVSSPPVYVNGQPTNVPAIVRGSQVFVPVRGVFEKLHAAVTYTPPQSVVARKGKADLVRLTLGSGDATVKGSPRTLATAPFLSGGRAFVPLRLLSEAAGASVAYSAAPREVRIVSPQAAVAAAPAPSSAPVARHHGIPWWVWLLIALVLLALLFALMPRRKSEPTISTRSSPNDPTIRSRR